MKHTSEPWEATMIAGYPTIHDVARTAMVCRLSSFAGADIQMANQKRIVACVNACAGINPEAVPVMLEVLKRIDSAFWLDPKDGAPGKANLMREALQAAIKLAES